MQEDHEKYFPALRLYVDDYRARHKWLIPLLIIWIGGALASSTYPAVGTVAMLALATLIFNSYTLGRTRCPKCTNHYMTHMFAAFSFTSKALSPDHLSCSSCGLRVCSLPEINCAEQSEHG